MPLDDKTYELFKQGILAKTGVDLNGYKEKQMKRRIDSLIARVDLDSYNEYLRLLDLDDARYREFLDRLTINVSEFFRNSGRWDVLRDRVIPMLRSSRPCLRTWSAACSTGEEPYSLAMLLMEGGQALQASILATDIDANALSRAQTGRFPAKALATVNPALLTRYFSRVDGDLLADDQLKKMIQFRRHDLITERYETGFDLIICRNVMIYFTEETKHRIYQKFGQALRPGGILFVGSTEQIFNARELGFASIEPFFYQKV